MDKIIPKLGLLRLKDLIKAIRACKTAADERAVIAKESAFIRTSFKEENNETRAINIAKLLYIHMLGYPAHFGQIECLKLVASPRFSDKRLGYLGIMLLLDENQEVLTLVTNCLKNDMNNANMFVVGLALCTLGNISSPEMSRDLCSEVEKLLGSSNTYIRKKAALCALRIIRKVPDLMENFVNRAKSLLNERNHGVLLTGVTLLTEMCNTSPEVLADVRKMVPVLVRHLKNLVTAGFSPEHDVSGITDPFLQVKILRLMRLVGKGDAEASDAMNDVLAQVATNTESSKNVGNAILYETVLTIMDIESESSLRVLGINILGRFLGNRDNNIRYVALTTLAKTATTTSASDSSALQRHRSTILDCLRDPDISIRRRALDLAFHLINQQNIRILTRELLSFLEVCEGDIKSSVASRICEYASRYRPNKRWECDTVVRVLRVAGSYVDQAVVNHFVKLVTTSGVELQQYTVRKVYNIIVKEGEKAMCQEGLVQAMVWSVGEFGDVLVGGSASTAGLFGADEEGESSNAAAAASEYQSAPSEKEVVDLFDSLLRGPYATDLVKQYAVTALLKLSGRFTGEVVSQQIRTLVQKYRTHIDMELQQRAVEYSAFWNIEDMSLRVALLERMPVLETAAKEEAQSGNGLGVLESPVGANSIMDGLGNDLLGLTVGGSGSAATAGASAKDDIYSMVFGGGAPAAAAKPAKSDNIMDLLGDIGLGAPTTAPSRPAAPASAAKPAADLLGDLFGGGAASAPSASKPAAVDPLAALLGTSTSTPSTNAKSYPAYDKNNLQITLTPTKDVLGGAVDVTARFVNNGFVSPIVGLSFQVAVPKTLRLVMQPPSGTTLEAGGGSAVQNLRIENPSKVPIRLRLKVSYTHSGSQQVDEIVEFSSFDASLWA